MSPTPFTEICDQAAKLVQNAYLTGWRDAVTQVATAMYEAGISAQITDVIQMLAHLEPPAGGTT